MRTVLAVAIAMLVVPACKSGGRTSDIAEVKKEAPDAKPTLHVAEDDPRYVASPNTSSRQVHYYSAKNDITYVVDESSGKVVKTYKSKDMPGVVVIEKPAYQPPPLKTQPAPEKAPAETGAANEGCGATAEEAIEVVEEPEGCGCGK